MAPHTSRPRRLSGALPVALSGARPQVLSMKKELNPVELDFLLRFPFKAGLVSPVDFLQNQGWGGIKVRHGHEHGARCSLAPARGPAHRQPGPSGLVCPAPGLPAPPPPQTLRPGSPSGTTPEARRSPSSRAR